ncbi:hypothetical protein, partial [Escherichia coli]|uniref:hypothetical protein n=1 Tax=Escherichia coli TaxID=562 RepID=UPI001AD8D0D4
CAILVGVCDLQCCSGSSKVLTWQVTFLMLLEHDGEGINIFWHSLLGSNHLNLLSFFDLLKF